MGAPTRLWPPPPQIGASHVLIRANFCIALGAAVALISRNWFRATSLPHGACAPTRLAANPCNTSDRKTSELSFRLAGAPHYLTTRGCNTEPDYAQGTGSRFFDLNITFCSILQNIHTNTNKKQK